MAEKTRLRREAIERRDAMADRAGASRAVLQRIEAMPEYGAAAVVSAFVGVGSEVETLSLIERALGDRRRVAVPWVSGRELRLFDLRDAAELAPAPFGLLEPPRELRADPARSIEPATIDLFVVPGLAFDRSGGRLGHGRGYYDGLLARARPGAVFVAAAFECQLFETVPREARDGRVHAIATERALHRVAGRLPVS